MPLFHEIPLYFYLYRDTSIVNFKCYEGYVLQSPYPANATQLECHSGYYTAKDLATGEFLPPKKRQTYRCVDRCMRMCKPNGECNKKTKTCNCNKGYEGNTSCSRVCPKPMSAIQHATSTPGQVFVDFSIFSFESVSFNSLPSHNKKEGAIFSRTDHIGQ